MPPLTSCPLKEIERGPNECPISWETDIKDIIQKKRTDPELYTWLMDNIGKCIVGIDIWKNDVRTGNKSISKVMTESSEAVGLVLMVNHWSSWGEKAKADTTDEDDASSSGTSTNSAASTTLYTKTDNCSTKAGWSDKGLEYYDQLKKEVKADRSSEQGKEFEHNFKAKMKEQSGATNKRKRGGSCKAFVENDLSDNSDDEEGPHNSPRVSEAV
jgi:hypothetical protein